MAEKLLLKKYANRRLYDTEKSKYVSLNQVAEIIKQGREVEVIEAKTKKDVTSFILTQIILEEARKNSFLLPAPLLHLMIQYGENVLTEFFENYLQQTIKNYLAYKHTADEQFSKWLELSFDFSEMAQKTLTERTPFKALFDLFPGSVDKQKEDDEGEQ
ncbi:MAG: polyhydroxyalkanoate synthesis regulator DNA-binding domain-containing protein [Deltaproteobacteria bacterium]|nr:MAG: polyhydroxyalkanoate synthesis regulator DNA-binding domain-containing protein [Deltaproteobacteria bacterium]